MGSSMEGRRKSGREEEEEERSGRSAPVHCFFACSSSSRHPSSLFKPKHRGCLALGHCCQRLETQGQRIFQTTALQWAAIQEKKFPVQYSFNRRQARFGLSRSGTADGQHDGWMRCQTVMEEVLRTCAKANVPIQQCKNSPLSRGPTTPTLLYIYLSVVSKYSYWSKMFRLL